MPTSEIDEFVRRAEQVYHDRLQSELEPAHADEFVAIEPDSGDYFLGRTLSEAIGRARMAHPDRLAHAIRIGHQAAVHFGVNLS
jgi:hypothetical protein